MPCNQPTDPSGFSPPEDWGECLIQMTRVMAGDFDTEHFSDYRILQVIKAAAFYVVTDLSCCSNVETPSVLCDGTISENPVDTPGFANLVVLKAACLLDQGKLRQKAIAEGIKAVAGPVSLSVVNSSNSFSLLMNEGPCAAYKQLKEDLCWRCPTQAGANCAQILGPFTSPFFDNCGGRFR